MTGRRADAVCWSLLALFTVFLLAVNLSYSRANTRPPTYDDAWYLETSLVFYRQLTEGGLRAFLPAYAGSFGTKAPLISVLPLPFYLVFGTSIHAALLVNSLFVVITNVYLFLLARRLFSPTVGLAAVVFYQTMPLAYGLSRAFLADYGLAALVIVWLYYLVASDYLQQGGVNFLLGILLGVGLLMKILFPAFIAGPLVVTLIARRKRPPREPREQFWLWRWSAQWPLAAIGAPGLAIAATWYAFHLGTILRYAWQGAYGEIGAQYGFGGLTHWLVLVVNRGISLYYAAAVVVVGAAALAFGRRREGGHEAVWLLAAWLVPPLLATAAGSNREIRFVIPLLPVFAIFLAAAVFRLGHRPVVGAALTLLLVIFPLRLYAELSFRSLGHGQHDHDHPVQAGPFVLFARDLGWARPPDSQGEWGQQRVLEAIHSMEPPSTAPRYVVVGIEHPYLNANLLSYLNAYSQYPLLFTSLGYAETSADRAVERMYRLDARFLILAEGFHRPDLPEFLNQVNDEIRARIDRGELPFRLQGKIALTHHVKAAIYKRDAPWASFPPGTGYDPPAHAMAVDFFRGPRFLGYDWKRKHGPLAEISFYWTVPDAVDEDYMVRLEFLRGARVVLVQDHFIAGGRRPFFEWAAGEVVKQTLLVHVPREGPLEARLWLAPWGFGGPLQVTSPREMIHESRIPLRLED